MALRIKVLITILNLISWILKFKSEGKWRITSQDAARIHWRCRKTYTRENKLRLFCELLPGELWQLKKRRECPLIWNTVFLSSKQTDFSVCVYLSAGGSLVSLTKSYCVTKASVSCSPTQISRFSLTGPSCLGFILTNVGERSVWSSSTLKSSVPLPLSPNTDGSRCSWHSKEQHLTALIHLNAHNRMCKSGIDASAHLTLLTYSRCKVHTLKAHTHTYSKTHTQQHHMLPHMYKSSQ